MDSDERIADDFTGGGLTYLNNASVSITPSVAINAVADFLASYAAMGPDSPESEPFVEEQLCNTRAILAQIIRCKSDELVLTQSTTDGVNAVAGGLSLRPGSNIIIRGADHEHHANYYPWLRLAGKTELRSLNTDENGLFDMAQLRHMIDENTALVVLSHALYNTGAILPVAEIGELLRSHNIPFFIDAAQTVGCTPVDAVQTGCDFMAFNGSKWLCGPMGTGLFYCKRGSEDLLEPLGVGGESASSDSGSLEYKAMPDRFQTGFRNYSGMAGLAASAGYLTRYGIDNIRGKVARLSSLLRAELLQIPGITVHGPTTEEGRTSIVPFTVRGLEPAAIVERLAQQHRIILAVREIGQDKIVRASPHFFNTEQQMHETAQAIKSL